MKRIVWLTVLAAVAALAQQTAPVSVVALQDGVYWVKGGAGANTGFIIGKTEVLVIDAKTTAESARAMLAEIGQLTQLPVRQVVLTHSDGDHVGGLSGLPAGLTVVAHANTRRDMEEALKDPKMSALQAYMPTEVVTGDRRLKFDGPSVNLLHFGAAHTAGDLVVHLPAQKIAFVGDLVFVGRDPLIHARKGGTSFGLVKYLNQLLKVDADTFITGHSDPLTKADIKTAQASIEERQAKVKGLMAQGKSLEEIQAAFGVTSAAGQPARRFPSLIEIIYQELTEKR